MTRRARWRVLYEAREIWKRGFRTFDTETTGLGRERNDEIVQWAVCSQNGEVLGSGYVKPTVPISAGAEAIHGIRDEHLSDAPTFDQIWPTIESLLGFRTVVIYNADFDLLMLKSSARPYEIKIPFDFVATHCAMHLFARYYGDIHEYWGTYVWQKLETALGHLKIEVPGHSHNAEHDAAATALILKKLAELAEQELPEGWHPPVSVPCAGCGRGVKQCSEPDSVWYCQSCGLERGVFHRCSGCNHIVESPASGVSSEELCQSCQKALHQEKMLLSSQWHWCPDQPHHIVETADPEEPCQLCLQQREWKRMAQETERLRQERIAQERREQRRAYSRDYRRRLAELARRNAERSALGLPPIEKAKPVPREEQEPFLHHGHLFKWIKEDGSWAVQCQKCQAVWSRPPDRWCSSLPTYRAWSVIPDHLLTRTQLRKIGLGPAKDQTSAAMVIGQFDSYKLYDRGQCVPIVKRVGEEAKREPSVSELPGDRGQ